MASSYFLAASLAEASQRPWLQDGRQETSTGGMSHMKHAFMLHATETCFLADTSIKVNAAQSKHQLACQLRCYSIHLYSPT